MRNILVPRAVRGRHQVFEVTRPFNYGHTDAENLSPNHIQRVASLAFGKAWEDTRKALILEDVPVPREFAGSYPVAPSRALTLVYAEEITAAAQQLRSQTRNPDAVKSERNAYMKLARTVWNTSKQFDMPTPVLGDSLSHVSLYSEGDFDTLRLKSHDGISHEGVAALRDERNAYLHDIGTAINSDEFAPWALETFGDCPTLPLARISPELNEAVAQANFNAGSAGRPPSYHIEELAGMDFSQYLAHTTQENMNRPHPDTPQIETILHEGLLPLVLSTTIRISEPPASSSES